MTMNDHLMPLITRALGELGFKYHIDEAGDAIFSFSRRRGKDLDFEINHASATKGYLAIACYCFAYFAPSETLDALMLCNRWNADKKAPRAYLTDPDTDGDRVIALDHHMPVSPGCDVATIALNIDFMVRGALMFWDEADQKI